MKDSEQNGESYNLGGDALSCKRCTRTPDRNLARNGVGALERKSRMKLDNVSPRIASRRVTRALTLLHRASRQLEAASQSAPDRYHKDEIFSFALGLRGLCLPLGRVASRLERGAE
jgi:hypothetical protein